MELLTTRPCQNVKTTAVAFTRSEPSESVGSNSAIMHLYAGLAAWGVAAFIIYKLINLVVEKRQLAG